MTACAQPEAERECPTFEVDGQTEFRPGGTAPALGERGLIELAVGLCAYDDQNLLIAFAPTPVFAEDYLHRARLLLSVNGADIDEVATPDSRGFFANVPGDPGDDVLNVTVNYVPQISQEFFGDGLELSELGLQPGDGFLLVGYNQG